MTRQERNGEIPISFLHLLVSSTDFDLSCRSIRFLLVSTHLCVVCTRQLVSVVSGFASPIKTQLREGFVIQDIQLLYDTR